MPWNMTGRVSPPAFLIWHFGWIADGIIQKCSEITITEKYHEQKESKEKNIQTQASGSVQAHKGSPPSQREGSLQAQENCKDMGLALM